MLQQRSPQIQPRSFHSMAAPVRQPIRQPRAFAMKRNFVRVPSQQHEMPAKQRRVEQPMQGSQCSFKFIFHLLGLKLLYIISLLF